MNFTSPVEYHVWSNGKNVPVVYHNKEILNSYLSKLTSGDVVLVTERKVISENTRVYGISGGSPLPPAPVQVPNSTSVTITHVIRIK